MGHKGGEGRARVPPIAFATRSPSLTNTRANTFVGDEPESIGGLSLAFRGMTIGHDPDFQLQLQNAITRTRSARGLPTHFSAHLAQVLL